MTFENLCVRAAFHSLVLFALVQIPGDHARWIVQAKEVLEYLLTTDTFLDQVFTILNLQQITAAASEIGSVPLSFWWSSSPCVSQVASQPGLATGTKVQFTGELFQPVPWSPTTKHGMPQVCNSGSHSISVVLT